jgi:glucokinase
MVRWLDLPVSVLNDVRAATWGEWLHGAGRGYDDLVCLFIGTGIGGGAVCGGRLLTGADNSGGEFGHIGVSLDGPRCSCCNRGCLESLAGGWAIARQAREAIGADPPAGKGMLDRADKDMQRVTARVVADAFHEGDSLATQIVERVSSALESGTVSMVNAFNPRRIILGGGVIHGLPELRNRLESHLRRNALKVAVESLEVVTASLGEDAAALGAAAYAHRISGGESSELAANCGVSVEPSVTTGGK